MRGTIWAAALGLLLAAAVSAQAGWEIEQTNYSLRSSGKEIGRSPSKLWVSKDRIRVDDGTSVSIFDYGKDRVALLLPSRKTYWSGTIDQYIEAVRTVNPTKRVLPGELEKVRKPPIVVSETPITAEIAGKQTKKYIIAIDGYPYQELWIAPPFLGSDLNLETYMEVQRKLARTVRSSYGTNLNFLADDPLYKKINTEGYPVRVQTYLGEAVMGSEIVSITQRELPDSDFSVPEGYSAVPLGSLLDEQQKVIDQKVAEQRKIMDKELPKVKKKPTEGKKAGGQKK